jgi:hypothetical protein
LFAVPRRRTDELAALDVRAAVRAARGMPPGEPLAVDGLLVVLDLDAGALAIAWAPDGRLELARVELVATAPNYGGARWWGVCPGCGRRAALLYLDASGPACRGCAELTYRRAGPLDRAVMRRTRARAALGAGPGALDPIPERPPGVWRSTWTRRLQALRAAELAVHAAVRPELARIGTLLASSSARRARQLEAAEHTGALPPEPPPAGPCAAAPLIGLPARSSPPSAPPRAA